MAIKAIFKTPAEMVEHVLFIDETVPLQSIKVKCMGMDAYAYTSDRDFGVRISRLDMKTFVIADTVRIFWVDYIESIEFAEKDSGQVHSYSVEPTYFRKYIKEEILSKIDGMQCLNVCNK